VYFITMPLKKKAKNSVNKKGKGNGGPRSRNDRLTGDIPGTPRCDIVTSSTTIPRATSKLMFHQHAPPVLVTAGPVAVSDSIQFALSSLEGTGTLVSLFDFYRIDTVRVTIRPQNTAVQVTAPTTTKLVEFYSVIDYNDQTPAGSAAYMREYDNCVITFPGESAARIFRPKMSAVVKSAAGTDYMSVEPQWLNTSSDDVLHYGVKYYVPSVLAAQTNVQVWQIDIELWIEFSKVTGG